MKPENKPKKEGQPRQKPQPKPTLFKTMDSRVNFLVLFITLGFTAVGAFLIYQIWTIAPLDTLKKQGLGDVTNATLVQAAVIAGLLGFVVYLLAMIIGDYLITRRTKKIVQAMFKVMGGEGEAAMIPRGMGELDEVTEVYEQCMLELDRTRKTIETQVKSRTSEAELSKGLTELQLARLEALLASMGEAVVATDNEGRVSFLNQIARESLWWRDPRVQGVSIHDAFQLEDEKSKIMAAGDWPIWQTIKEGRTVVTPAPNKPFYLRRQDNSRFPVKFTFSPVRVGEEVVGALAVFSDITEEVEFDRRKSEFISVASHQLRSPSSAIRMMTDMMRKGDFGPFNDKQHEWVEKLFIASDNMVELINQLLSISRIEAGVKIALEEQDTNAFLDNLLAEAESMLLEKKQKFDYRRPELPRLVFDRFMMGEVLKNFISNAAKYSPNGATVGVTAEMAGTEVKFSIRDQGIGIPKGDYKQMFNKFFRAENALKSPTKGTGLGLFFCKSAVEMHGGRIGFESEEGKGSTFWFTLPIKSSAQSAAPAAPTGTPTAPAAKPKA